MEDDLPPPARNYPTSTAKMSKTPSWIMLGFILGAAFVAALPPLRKKPPAAPPEMRAVPPAPSTAPREPQPLTTIEAVFADWGRHAVWSDDVTEVALWNSREKAYTDFYEVRRLGGTLYFRSIPQLTRRKLARGKPLDESPLQFTETEEQYEEWRQFGRRERPSERELRPAAPSGRTGPESPRVDNGAGRPALPALERILLPPEYAPPREQPRN